MPRRCYCFSTRFPRRRHYWITGIWLQQRRDADSTDWPSPVSTRFRRECFACAGLTTAVSHLLDWETTLRRLEHRCIVVSRRPRCRFYSVLRVLYVLDPSGRRHRLVRAPLPHEYLLVLLRRRRETSPPVILVDAALVCERVRVHLFVPLSRGAITAICFGFGLVPATAVDRRQANGKPFSSLVGCSAERATGNCGRPPLCACLCAVFLRRRPE